jgi:hypothetical protein
MPLIPAFFPPQVDSAFINGLPRFLPAIPGPINSNYLSANPPLIPSLGDLGAYRLQQPVFTLSLTAAANNNGTINPPATGWRVFAGNAVGKIVLGRVAQLPAGGWKLVGILFGIRVFEALVVSQSLGAYPQVADAPYQVRFLAIPGMNVEAFWLAPLQEGPPDWILPFTTNPDQLPTPLQGIGIMTLATFLALIKPVAAGLLTMSADQGA